MELELTSNELKLLVCGVSWSLYSPFYLSVSPVFSKAEAERLVSIHSTSYDAIHEPAPKWDATLSPNLLIVRGRTIAEGDKEIKNLWICLTAFHREIGHSPNEVMAVTGVSLSILNSLLERFTLVACNNQR